MILVDEPQKINELFGDNGNDNFQVHRGKLVVCVIDDEDGVLEGTRRRITDMEKEGTLRVHRFQRIANEQMASFVLDIAEKLKTVSKAHIVPTTQLLDTVCRYSDGKIARAIMMVKWLLDVSEMVDNKTGEYPFEEVTNRIAGGTLTKDAVENLSSKHGGFVEDIVDFAADSFPVPNNLDSLAQRNEAMCQYDMTRDVDMLLLSMSQENCRDNKKKHAAVRPDLRKRRDTLLLGPKDSILPLSIRRIEERAAFNVMYRMCSEWMSRNDNVRSLTKTKKTPFPTTPEASQLHGPLSFLDSMWLRRGDSTAFYRTQLNVRSAAASFVFADEVELPPLPSPLLMMLLHARKSESRTD